MSPFLREVNGCPFLFTASPHHVARSEIPPAPENVSLRGDPSNCLNLVAPWLLIRSELAIGEALNALSLSRKVTLGLHLVFRDNVNLEKNIESRYLLVLIYHEKP